MHFSLILNSRGRPTLLKNLLDSIQNATKDLSNVEVLIRFDEDDPTLKECVSIIHNYNFVRYWIESKLTNIHTSLNELAFRTKGKYIFVLNDDCVITNENWDYHVWNQLEDYLVDKPDGIVYGKTIDNSCDKGGNKQYASFPIISRIAIDVLGFFMHENFVGLGGDVAIYRVYSTINRVVEVCVIIDHVLHHTVEQVIHPDETAAHMRQNTYQNPQNEWEMDISQDINKLKKVIDK